MSVPPSSRPSSTPSSKEKEREREPEPAAGTKKDFRLPNKEKDKDEKKKSLFDLAGGEAPGVKQDSLETSMSEGQHISQMSAVSAKDQVAQIGQLIQKMVAAMQIGTAGGKHFASVTLKASHEVPVAFAGSNLTLNYKENGLAIRFDHFADVQQEQNAVFLVEKNKEQLIQMLRSCEAKNIHVSEFNIGSHTIALPRVQPLPPPFQPSEAGPGETRQEREQQDEREGKDENL